MSDFLWGVASSSFQSEGHLDNDMTRWESAGHFKKNGRNPLYENGSNHWQMWEQDFESLKQLNVNAYRFSLEWSRIEPEPGYFSEPVLKQYDKMIERLLQLNIVPMLTLHHFSHPAWFHSYSPWTSNNAVQVFYRFAKKIIRRYAEKVPYWISFNEPLVWALAAYGDGQFPPGEKNPKLVMQALHHILVAHKEVYHLLKTYNPEAKMGIAKHFIVFKEARNWCLPDKGIADRLDYFFNKLVLQAFETNRLRFQFWPLIKYDEEIELNNKIDFWGINYYYRMHTRFQFSFKQPVKLVFKNQDTDMGWEIYPQGLKKIIRLLETTGKDILITENGIATTNEKQRASFIDKHIRIVKSAAERNPKIKGYFYWSFLDNYEWLEGKSKRFGLIHVNYNDGFRRTLKESARCFSERRIFT